MEIALFVGILVVFYAGYALWNRHACAEEWEAVIESVEQGGRPYRVGDDRAVRDSILTVTYRKTDGTRGSFKNAAVHFVLSGHAGVKPGDRLIKKKGEAAPRLEPTDPEKEEQSGRTGGNP